MAKVTEIETVNKTNKERPTVPGRSHPTELMSSTERDLHLLGNRDQLSLFIIGYL
jgi:hypothetical protein